MLLQVATDYHRRKGYVKYPQVYRWALGIYGLFLVAGVFLLRTLWHLQVGEFEDGVIWGCGTQGWGIWNRLRWLLPRASLCQVHVPAGFQAILATEEIMAARSSSTKVR